MFPTLYQVHTRVFLTELSKTLNRPATLDDVSDELLDDFAQQGFDLLLLLGIW